MLPEWSKGLHLRCTVFALAGSNPAHSSLTFPFFGLNAALRPLRFDAIQVFFKGPSLWPFEPNHKEHVQCPTSSRRRLRRAPPDVNRQWPPNSSVRKSVRTRFSPPLRLVVVNIVVQRQRSVAPPPSVATSAPRAALIDTHMGSTYTKVPRPSPRADAIAPPAHPPRACLRAKRYRQTSLADRHTSSTHRRTTWCPSS